MKYAYKNGIILDGTKDMKPVEGKVIFTDNETIVNIEDAKTANLTGYQVIDLKGKYIMPGLINLHVHIPGSGKPKKKQADMKKLVKLLTSTALTRYIITLMYRNYAKTSLMSGVTTIRSVGGIDHFDTDLRNDILANKVVGPRVLAGDMAVSVPEGHMAGSLAYEATSPEEAVKFVEKIAENKPDLIKLMITGGVMDAIKKGEPGVLRMSPEIVKAACDKAHELGFMVAAHVESTEGVKVALENGVDTIEHGAKPTKEIIKLFKEKNAVQISTISPALPYALFPLEISHATEVQQFNGNVVFQGIIECANECLKNGIPVGLGTDVGCPYITHYDMWRELYYFVKFCKVTNKFALYSATLGNAKIVHLEDKIGSIEVGKCADFITTKENPLENLQALRNVSSVTTRGHYIPNPVVKKMENVERELDKYL